MSDAKKCDQCDKFSTLLDRWYTLGRAHHRAVDLCSIQCVSAHSAATIDFQERMRQGLGAAAIPA